MNQKAIKFCKSVTTCMVVSSMLLAFLIAGIRIFGFQVFGVLTGSMEPTYPIGSLIYVKAAQPNDLHVNDVITFSLSPNVIATHRIVEVVQDETNPSVVRYRTKGDANKDVDASLVSVGNIIGKVSFAIPQLGYLASYIQQPPGLYVAILVCAIMVAFVFYTDSLENKQEENKAVNQAAKEGTGLAKWIGLISGKLPGKTAAKPNQVPPAGSAGFNQGYVPQQPVQQPRQTAYGMPNPYAQQGYGQQNYAQPAMPVQQPYYHQPSPQQDYRPCQQQPVPPQPYPQQVYGQQAYQQPHPQQVTYPQQASYPPQQAYLYPQYGYQQLYAPSAQQAGQSMQQDKRPQRSRLNRYGQQNQSTH